MRKEFLTRDHDLCATSAGLLSEDPGNRLCLGDQSVPCKLQAFDRALGGFLVTGTTGVSYKHKHRNISEVGAVTGGRFDSDLGLKVCLNTGCVRRATSLRKPTSLICRRRLRSDAAAIQVRSEILDLPAKTTD